MIPEQVWDAEDIPERSLFNGHPTGSGMPLVWAHSEYIKLLRSLHSGAIWDLPTQTVKRYLQQKQSADFQIWMTKQRRAWLAKNKKLRVDLDCPSKVEWSFRGSMEMESTRDTSFHLHVAMLPLHQLPENSEVRVTIHPDDPGDQAKADSFTIRIRGIA